MDNPEIHTTLNTQDTDYWFPLRLSLTFTYCLYTVSCVFDVVCVSGLSIIGFLFGYL
jgi:hypothetical protein